jgi:hypothetical protein
MPCVLLLCFVCLMPTQVWVVLLLLKNRCGRCLAISFYYQSGACLVPKVICSPLYTTAKVQTRAAVLQICGKARVFAMQTAVVGQKNADFV